MAPVFGLLTAINLYTTYKSVDNITEIYLNNQRSKLLFDQYLAEGNDRMPTMREINSQEFISVPNFLNKHYCRFVAFGKKSISQVIGMTNPKYYITSVMHQLHKDNRNFVYYI